VSARVAQNVVVQQGEAPHEDPEQLLREGAAVIEELRKLVVGINTANLTGKTEDGRNLTAALAQRDALAQQHAMLVAALAATNKEPDRYSTREIKWVATVKVKDLQKRLEDLSRTIRETNLAIQAANWKIEV
jgi:hypothetical protein